MYNIKLLDRVKKKGYVKIKSLMIDIVYLWVDSEDPKWITKYKNYKIKNNENNHFDERFKNFNEIYFSLNTVAKFLNFISHIYIITDDQQLNLRKIDKSIHSKIRMVNHTDIIPKKYLPVFNSELIQPFIHKIPKLSENILVFDDDFFIGNYIEINDIFDTQNNVLKSYWIYRKVYDNYFTKKRLKDNNALISTYKTFKIFKKKFGFYPDLQTPHITYFLTKSSMKMAYELFKNELISTFKYKIRSPYNIKFLNLSGYVGIYYGFLKLTNINKINYKTYLFETPEATKKEVKNIFKKTPKLFVINRINTDTQKYFDLVASKYIKQF